jgi:hypothetical protein
VCEWRWNRDAMLFIYYRFYEQSNVLQWEVWNCSCELRTLYKTFNFLKSILYHWQACYKGPLLRTTLWLQHVVRLHVSWHIKNSLGYKVFYGSEQYWPTLMPKLSALNNYLKVTNSLQILALSPSRRPSPPQASPPLKVPKLSSTESTSLGRSPPSLSQPCCS